jgi:predicted O-methyltransferase YrrM
MNTFTLNDIILLVKTFSEAPTRDDFIDKRYDLHKEKFGSYLRYYRLFYHLAKWLEPELVVELGGWQGTAAAHFASGYSKAQVITIDHLSDPGDDLNKIKMLEATAQYPNLIYLQGWTWDMYQVVAAQNRPIDLLFIDSWHDYEHAMRDWNDYKPLLASPALVICDDIIGGYGAVISGMLDFWNDLPGEKWLEPATLNPGYPMGFMRYEANH